MIVPLVLKCLRLSDDPVTLELKRGELSIYKK